MSSSSQNPEPSNPSRRDDLLLMLLHGGAATNAIATYVVDAFAAEVKREAAREIAALRESERILQRQIDAQAVELDRVRAERDEAKGQVATARTEVIASAADGLYELGEKQAAYLLRTVDVVEAGAR